MGGEVSICSRYDDLTYNEFAQSPAAYAAEIRRIHISQLMAQQKALDSDDE